MPCPCCRERLGSQEFNSLDAQRESAEAFIASQKAERWVVLPDRYDDGGFSGGTMERPALDRLLRDIEDGKIDCVVVYKVDRLSRSLMDFSRIMETFEKAGVSFVSVALAPRRQQREQLRDADAPSVTETLGFVVRCWPHAPHRGRSCSAQ